MMGISQQTSQFPQIPVRLVVSFIIVCPLRLAFVDENILIKNEGISL
jgi:hypothetical protein